MQSGCYRSAQSFDRSAGVAKPARVSFPQNLAVELRENCRQCGHGSPASVLRGSGRGQPRQRLAVIPGHPLRRTSLQLLGVPQQLGQIIERIGSVQLASVDQTHEQIADSGAVQRLIEECVLAVQNGFLQSTLDDVMPRPGLCRARGFPNLSACFLMVPDAA